MIYSKKRYKILLTPQTPLFIGDGKRLTKKEYAYSDEKEKIYILHPQKFFGFLRQEDLLKHYEEFMKDESMSDLSEWFSDYNIELSENQPWVAYSVKKNGNDPFKANEIHCFIKNGYGKPYIPGSSLKGAFRTAILVSLLKDNDWPNLDHIKEKYQKLNKKGFSDCGTEVSNIAESNRDLEQQLLNHLGLNRKRKHALNDMMRAIRIYDSSSIEGNCLSLCKKVDVSCNQGIKEEHEINMLRESLTLKKEIEMEMTIDEQLLKRVSCLDAFADDYVQMIHHAIQQYGETVSQYFVNHFKDAVKPEKDTIYLGGGTGLASKTILPSLLGDEGARDAISRILYTNFSSTHKHDILDTQVSPHILKCTKQEDNVAVQFGMCKIKIVEL